MEQGVGLTISVDSLIAVPLMIWIGHHVYKTSKRIERIERYLMSRATEQKVNYIPDEATLAEARRIATLRERHQQEMREMEDR